MPVRFPCQSCQTVLRTSRRKIGSRLNCPKCGKPLEVPSEARAQELIAHLKEQRRAADSVGSQDPLAEFTVYDEDADLVYEDDEESLHDPLTGVEIDRTKVAVPRMVIYIQAGLLGFIAVFSFLLGTFVGRRVPDTSTAGDPRAQVIYVEGQVYTDRSHEDTDSGAVVIALPKNRKPDDVIEIAGLGPDLPMPDLERHAGVAAIRELGGNYTRTDHRGEFDLRLPRPEEYYILVISAERKRPGDKSPRAADLDKMRKYFFKTMKKERTAALQLLDQHAYSWDEKELKSGTELLLTVGD